MNLVDEFIKFDWNSIKGWRLGVVLPERMIGLKHAKAARLLSHMTMKYGLLQHYVQPGASVLDVGCGSGYGCSLLQTFGYKAYGVDIDDKILEFAKKRPGIEYFNCTIESLLKKHEGQFDAVTSVDMIEHIHAPQQVELMKTMKRLLKPGGTLLVDTPYRVESASVSSHHVWELGHQDFLKLFTDEQFENIDRFYIVRHFDTFSTCVKTMQPPKVARNQGEIFDQIIIGKKGVS